MGLPLLFRRRTGISGQFVWKVFFVALGLRLCFVLFYPQIPPIYGDDRMYDQVGWNLATGKGFVGGFAGSPLWRGFISSPDDPEVGIGPVYPAFLALIYLTVGHDPTAVRIVQAFLSAAIILVLYAKVRAVCGKEVAKLSAALIALYPAFIIYPGVLLTETLFLFLLTLLVSSLIRAVQSDSAWRWVLAGNFMGVTILLRAETVAIVPVFAALILWRFPQRGLIRKVSLFLLVTALTVGVWTARNYLVFKEFILVSAHGGDTVWISTKGWTEWHLDDEELQSLVQGLNYVEQNNTLRREGIRNILKDPLHYFILSFKRLPHFWIGSHSGYLVGLTDTYKQYYTRGAFGKLFLKVTLLGANLSIIFMGVWGAFITLKAEKERLGLRLFFLVPIVVIAIIHFFLFATPRFNVPIMPFILVFAAISLYRLGLVRTPRLLLGLLR